MTAPHERLATPAHARLAEHRRDQSWLDARWSDPTTRVLVLAGAQVQRRPEGGVAWSRPDELGQVGPAEDVQGERVLLGETGGRTWFAVLLPDPAPEAEGWFSLRALLMEVVDALAAPDADDAVPGPVLMHAIGMAEWRRATRFCPRCSSPLRLVKGGHEMRCEAHDHPQFPRMDPAVIMLISHGEPGSAEEKALLGHQSVWPEGRYSTLAGFCEPGETMEDAVRREVHEEAGVHVGQVDYFGNQPWPLPQSLMLGFTGRATTTEVALLDEELTDARWFTRAELLEHTQAGTVVLPQGLSISRSLIEAWYGGELPGSW
ncbi:NAD(+) diphosphatase [Nocardioides bruguierae]|uniref:NAD(+) diphosphatase n=1 Tax=Nocardioides bruguierae TaxID=2945102 RepID=UPI002021157C|nr:NAD(+) diphosphatase [Nocardioides bruguierae]MCL8024915.1 NAD(+) diphosphatase [Nocardioides bruguierae]